ncbi:MULTISPECIES: hypothetical protein [Niastella]|uniref:Uncharacterized protein n=1 Tax=Niastella soli TaxID=2821487 RepID=A0ABS3YQN0_9BACT|nr:hypothetical protein [Niastella soli]MBO9200221.1 hypothetical protein [Niastella soli]
MKKIKDTSPDKVHGKLVKYRKGDCLSVLCGGKYLAVLISRKFNKYYDLTLLEYYKDTKPGLDDFENGKLFGTRFGSWKNLTYAVNVRMISCKYIDENINIELVGSMMLIPTVELDGYSYLNNADELLEYYLEELPIRIEKSKNAEKFPDLAFVSKHLIDTKHIIE